MEALNGKNTYDTYKLFGKTQTHNMSLGCITTLSYTYVMI